MSNWPTLTYQQAVDAGWDIDNGWYGIGNGMDFKTRGKIVG